VTENLSDILSRPDLVNKMLLSAISILFTKITFVTSIIMKMVQLSVCVKSSSELMFIVDVSDLKIKFT
jgi:hypothetical protein